MRFQFRKSFPLFSYNLLAGLFLFLSNIRDKAVFANFWRMPLFNSGGGNLGWQIKKKRKPKILDKLRGEWAEMVFMARATELGLAVSKPWGDARSYDVVVGRPGHFVAVQVKSTIFELEQGWICTVRSGHKPYPPGSFDFIAAYIVFEDVWYIIPAEAVLGMESVSLNTGTNRANYEEYREAWELLESGGGGPGKIEIQAGAEEFLLQ
jgi:PD-(D/E)XK endonuclease